VPDWKGEAIEQHQSQCTQAPSLASTRHSITPAIPAGTWSLENAMLVFDCRCFGPRHDIFHWPARPEYQPPGKRCGIFAIAALGVVFWESFGEDLRRRFL